VAIMAGIQNYYSSPQLLRCGLKEPRVHRSRNLNDMSGYQKFLRVCLKYGASRLSSHLYMPQCILINGLLIHRSRQYDLYSFSEELDLNLSLATNNNNNNDASGMAESQLREEVPLNTELGTTKMVDETTTQTLTTSHLTQLSTDFLFGAVDTNAQQDIKAFLEKPFLIESGAFSASDDATTFAPFNMPEYMLSQDFYYQKLKGNLFFKATLEFTLTVNANPFQQGRYLLTWCPTAGSPSNRPRSGKWVDMHTFSAMQRTQLPHVQLDLSSQTRVTFEVPFMSVYSSWITSANSYQFDTGQVRIYPYDPLTTGSGGSTTAGYSLWARFKEVHLSTAALPNAGGSFTSTTQEQRSQGVGPITSAAKKISRAANILTSVPILAPFTSTVSWAADIVAGVASVFGWSKPVNLASDDLIVRDIMYNIANYDTVDNSKVLALSAKNEVQNIPGFAATDLDELDFSTFLSIPSYAGLTIPWNTSQASGTLLTTITLSPGHFFNSYTDINGNVLRSFTPVSWLATRFARYRGGFALTFKIIKTRFHAGRLIFSFRPTNNYFEAPSPSIGLTAYLNRHIVDIRESSEFTLNFPYTSLFPYLDTEGGNDHYGLVDIHVLDELTGPSTVSTSINIIEEVAVLPDFEFAIPRPSNWSPVMNVGLNALPHSGGGFTQSNGDTFNTFNEYIGSTTALTPTLSPAKACIGERITSLRQLLKIPSASIVSATDPGVNYMAISPYCINAVWSKSVSGVPLYDVPYYCCDLYSQLASMFAMSRGGMRIKLMGSYGDPLVPNTAVAFLTPFYEGLNGQDFVNFSTVSRNGNDIFNNGPLCGVAIAISDLGTRGGLELQIPSYSRMHSRANCDMVVNTQNVHLADEANVTSAPDFVVEVYLDSTASPGEYLYIYRSLADDGNLGGFVSIPPMTTIPI
jgi:hypothetical protein